METCYRKEFSRCVRPFLSLKNTVPHLSKVHLYTFFKGCAVVSQLSILIISIFPQNSKIPKNESIRLYRDYSQEVGWRWGHFCLSGWDRWLSRACSFAGYGAHARVSFDDLMDRPRLYHRVVRLRRPPSLVLLHRGGDRSRRLPASPSRCIFNFTDLKTDFSKNSINHWIN